MIGFKINAITSPIMIGVIAETTFPRNPKIDFHCFMTSANKIHAQPASASITPS